MDYRLKENRFKLFKDFYWFHTKYKIHPGLVYLYLPEITKGMTKEQKYWTAFLEGCTQNPNTVYAILKFFPDRPQTEEEMRYFEEFCNDCYHQLEYDTDRIHYKGKLYKQLVEYNKLIGSSQEKVFEQDLYDADPKKYFTNVFEFVLKKVWGFGRMSTWSYVEFIKICCGLNYEYWNFYMNDQESSMSMRNGLFILYGRDDLHVWKELPDNPTSHTKEQMEWAEQEVRALLDYLKTQYTDIEVTGETLESALCAFKNMFRGRRYPNIYTDMSYDRIKKAESLWGNKIDYSIFWKIRAENLPLELLKEYNYNGYIRETAEVAVNLDKQMYFRNTGMPLYLGLFKPEYKIEEQLEFTSIAPVSNNTRVPSEPVRKVAEHLDIHWTNEPFTKEERAYIRYNKFYTQKNKGKTIYEELGFDKDWTSNMYDLTPIELKTDNGLQMCFKREDYFAPLGYAGINGAKLRQAMYLADKQVKGKDWDCILTGATSISPQLPMTCALAKYYGLECIGLSSAETSDMLEISKGFGGKFTKTVVGYNTYIQQQLMKLKETMESEGKKPFVFHYGLTIDFDNSTPEEIKEFYGVGANQVRSLLGTAIEDLVIALGSSNSSVAVMYGIMRYYRELNLKRVHLVGVGPNTLDKLRSRLEILAGYDGLDLKDIFYGEVGADYGTVNEEGKVCPPIAVYYYDTFSKKIWEYADRIYERFDDIDLHYTYEGKEMRFIKLFKPELIKPTTCFWIIGGPVDKKVLAKYYNK